MLKYDKYDKYYKYNYYVFIVFICFHSFSAPRSEIIIKVLLGCTNYKIELFIS